MTVVSGIQPGPQRHPVTPYAVEEVQAEGGPAVLGSQPHTSPSQRRVLGAGGHPNDEPARLNKARPGG